MAQKQVYLFDDDNDPLQVAGIIIELYDAANGDLLARELSGDRTPGFPGASDEWGADLDFDAVDHPVDILFICSNFEYPGNAVRNLNGQTTELLNIDLMKIPASPLSNPIESNSTQTDVAKAFLNEPQWTTDDKRGAINLLNSYVELEQHIKLLKLPGNNNFSEVRNNWRRALGILGVKNLDLGLDKGLRMRK